MTSYEVHIKLSENGKTVWKAVSPSGKNQEPYRFATENAADWHLIRSYGRIDGQGNIIRKVVKVAKPVNINLK
jgi:hypothetical protein